MIKINATTHTESGLTIATGSILNVTPHFTDYVNENGITKYNVSFDVDVYKNMAGYLAKNILVKTTMKEYNVGYTASNIDIQALTSVSDLIGLLATHIEDGDNSFSGVGVGKTEIVFPPIV